MCQNESFAINVANSFLVILPDPFETEITPWLLRRLDASTNIAIQIRDDASRVLQILDWSAGQHLVECDAA